jgi:hypothetical protein
VRHPVAQVPILGEGGHRREHPVEDVEEPEIRRGPHVNGRDRRERSRCTWGGVPLGCREGRDRDGMLERGDIGHVLLVEELGADQDEAQLCRAPEDPHVRGIVSRPRRAGDQELLAAMAVGAGRDVAEDVGVEVDQLR